MSENMFESDQNIHNKAKILKTMIINEQIVLFSDSVTELSSSVQTFVDEHNADDA